MKYILSSLFTLLTYSVAAQTTQPAELTITKAGPKTPDSTGKTVYQFVDRMPAPSFNVMEFLAKNTVYPDSAKRYGIQGRVLTNFVVNEDGTLSDFKTTRGIGWGCDREAIRVLKLMPPWKPGMQDGKPVKVYYTQPISFKLQ